MKSGSSHSKFGRIVKAPLRALCRVRDMYVSSLTGCAGRANYRGIVGYSGGSGGVPRSHSFHPSRSSSTREDDLRDLVRAASQGAMGSLNLGGFQQSPGKNHTAGDGAGSLGPRSQSVAIGRIDEDKPYELGLDATVGPLVPRSRSCAVTTKRVFVGVLA
ncbi:hypothetical protein Taro_028405 [Colocasia esculenta]|uniref:Uncharacterized protein n=1 Tax=Colocasia esculenta TaxID=4460 RepID=A0A843VX58_COLES|nr:hypothetical protein [Colocasia esculenta]